MKSHQRNFNVSLLQAVTFLLFLLFFPLIQGGCVKPLPVLKQEAQRKLIWPPPPQVGRITYVKEIVLPRDISASGGWWDRAKALLSGENLPVVVRPYGLTMDQDENLLIADTDAGRVHIYNLQTGRYRSLPHPGDDMVLISPIDLDLDADGKIYVSDSIAKSVYVFNPSRRRVAALDDFERPTGLVIDKIRSRIYVVDTLGHKIRVYGTTLEHLFDFGTRGEGAGEFNYPTNICLDGSGNVYVTDSMNFRVQVFDPRGEFLFTLGAAGNGPGTFSKPRGIGVDSDGNIYVADASFDNVQVLNPSGQALIFFGSSGVQKGEFYLPAGLMIDERDRIFVSDSYNRRVQVFQYLKEEDEIPKLTKPVRPKSMLMLSREGDSAFIVEKSTRSVIHFQMKTDEVSLVRWHPIQGNNVDRIAEGVYFPVQEGEPGSKRILLKQAFPDIFSNGARRNNRIILSWGGQNLVKSGDNAGAVISIREELGEVEAKLRSSLTPVIVKEKVDMVDEEKTKPELREILNVISSWEKSWERMDMEQYVGFYSNRFKQGQLNRKTWETYKYAVFASMKVSEVTLRPIHVLELGPNVILTFLQSFRSGGYKDLGLKKILMQKEGSEWKIVREVWTRDE